MSVLKITSDGIPVLAIFCANANKIASHKMDSDCTLSDVFWFPEKSNKKRARNDKFSRQPVFQCDRFLSKDRRAGGREGRVYSYNSVLFL